MPTDDLHLIIIGGGPAGLTAGLYAARARLNVLLVERGSFGGQVLTTHKVENYPGFPEGIPGPELADLFQQHAKAFGLETRSETVRKVWTEDGMYLVELGDHTLRSSSLILASGSRPRQLGVRGEGRLRGRGVSYCATCDGAFFRGEDLAVVGGGDSAVEEALFLTRFARAVTIIHRRDVLRATPILQERARQHPAVSFLWNTVIEEILGEQQAVGVKARNLKDGTVNEVNFGGIFITIGHEPETDLFKGLVELDGDGHIVADEATLATSAPGVFAAGDVRRKVLRQVATAVGDGALAVHSVLKYLEDKALLP
ncbi:MAG: thioredoxin-disulfide reductase [Firmicutes bacterium]|nr:thioredoxin-disulfide reductase [Bacillota bacterium]